MPLADPILQARGAVPATTQQTDRVGGVDAVRTAAVGDDVSPPHALEQTWDPTSGLEGPSGPGRHRVVASPSVPGQVTVLWRDGELRARSYRLALP